MIDSLLSAETALCWSLANYAFDSAPAEAHAGRRARFAVPLDIVLRSVAIGVLPLVLGPARWHAFVLGGALFITTLTACWLRRCAVPVRRLVEFELAANAAAAVLFGMLLTRMSFDAPLLFLNAQQRAHLAAIYIGAAVLLFTVQGGNLLVRSLLEKAGGMPEPDDPLVDAQTFRHGRMIGQIERIIVLIIVVGGNLAALAFFFAAKGLIRSKELEKRSRADYFLLGSLASFLIALAAGLALHRIFAVLWP